METLVPIAAFAGILTFSQLTNGHARIYFATVNLLFHFEDERIWC